MSSSARKDIRNILGDPLSFQTDKNVYSFAVLMLEIGQVFNIPASLLGLGIHCSNENEYNLHPSHNLSTQISPLHNSHYTQNMLQSVRNRHENFTEKGNLAAPLSYCIPVTQTELIKLIKFKGFSVRVLRKKLLRLHNSL